MAMENFGIWFKSRGYGQTHREMSSIQDKTKAMQTGFVRMGRTGGPAIGGITQKLLNMKTALAGLVAGYGLTKLAGAFITTASSMDQMRISLDTITKGEGEAWFRKLNEWALKMPINTERAIQSFIMMRAMGLQPTIKDMTTLVDTTSALGGQAGTLEGIARALGQIQTKGKVSAEELMQLAERGIPAYEILKEKLGLTAKQLGNIGEVGINAGKAVQALLEGMAERFGGQSEKIQSKWAGLIESLKSYWADFKRMVMESNVMNFIESGLKAIVQRIDEAKRTGDLARWARTMAEGVLQAFSVMAQGTKLVVQAIAGIRASFGGVVEAYSGAKLGDLYKRRESYQEKIEKGPSFLERGLSGMSDKEYRAYYEKQLEEVNQLIAKHEQLAGAGREMWLGNLNTIQAINEEFDLLIEKAREMRGGGGPTPGGEPGGEPGGLLGLPSKIMPSREEGGEDLEKQREKLNQALERSNALQLQAIEINNQWAESTSDVVAISAAEWEAYYTKQLELHGTWQQGIIGGLEEIKNRQQTIFQTMRDMTISVANAMENAFSDFFFDAMTGKLKSFKDYISSFFRDIARAISQALSRMLVSKLFSAIGLSAFHKGGIVGQGTPEQRVISIAPSIFHRGGIVGQENVEKRINFVPSAHRGGIIGPSLTPTRVVHERVFASAKRAHSGLRPGERPVIMKEDEWVFTPEQMKALGRGQQEVVRGAGAERGADSGPGGSMVNVNINAMDSQSFADICKRNPGAITGPIEEALRGNQPLRYTIMETTR